MDRVDEEGREMSAVLSAFHWKTGEPSIFAKPSTASHAKKIPAIPPNLTATESTRYRQYGPGFTPNKEKK